MELTAVRQYEILIGIAKHNKGTLVRVANVHKGKVYAVAYNTWLGEPYASFRIDPQFYRVAKEEELP